MVRMLLAKGADRNAKEGRTPLDLAKELTIDALQLIADIPNQLLPSNSDL